MTVRTEPEDTCRGGWEEEETEENPKRPGKEVGDCPGGDQQVRDQSGQYSANHERGELKPFKTFGQKVFMTSGKVISLVL